MPSRCFGPVFEEFKSSTLQQTQRAQGEQCSSRHPRQARFTLHDQSYTNPAVQAEQQDELRRKLGSTGLDNKRADGGSPLQVVTLSQGWSNMVLQLGRKGASAVQFDLVWSTADPQLHTQQLLQTHQRGLFMSFASAGTCSRC